MIWAIHGQPVMGFQRKMVLRKSIAMFEMPLVMQEIIERYQRDYVLGPELLSLTSLRFTGLEGDELIRRQAHMEMVKGNYIGFAHAQQGRPPAKAMPQVVTTSVRSPNIPSITITPKPMPASSSSSMPASRPAGHDGRDLSRRPDIGAPAPKAARHDDSTWSASSSSHWNSPAWKGSGKQKGKTNIIDVESNTSTWHTTWSAWQADTRDRQGKGWSWNSSGGK